MNKRRICLILMVLWLAGVSALYAAEVKNVVASQVGNRVQFTYDLVGEEQEAEVTVVLTVQGGERKTADLHLEGDVGKVRPGRGKVIWWNILQDFPRGLNAEIAWEITAGGQTFTDAATGMEFVFVKGGCFEMGDVFGDGEADEKPVHNVCVNDFYLGKYEVTQGQWQAVMGNNPSNFKNCGNNCPVENVSWNDTQDFIRRLNQRSGKSYRLPTEAEWEYAAREGGRRVRFGTGTDRISADIANFDASVSYKEVYSDAGEYRSKTVSVGSFRPNSLGLYDMAGNVWEWCQDWYGERYYSGSPRDNPQGPLSGQYRVLRGGSWYHVPVVVRAALRNWRGPANWDSYIGVRLAVSAP